MFIVTNDSRHVAFQREVQSAGEAKELVIEDIAFYVFYCAEKESTARNSIERKQWGIAKQQAELQLSIAQETPIELLHYGMVLFVGEHVFQIRNTEIGF